jgi:transposase
VHAFGMPRGRAFAIELTQEERDALERNVRRRKTSSALASRSRMVLLAAAGLTNLQIADRVGACGPTVGVWRNRFHEKRLEGLLDEPRVGRPREIGDDTIERVVVTTLEAKPSGATHWSTRSLAKSAGMSQSAISRIWRAFGLKPHRSDVFQLSHDPQLVEKVRDIVGLYLSPPANAAVFCVDEKTAVQALERSQPLLPLRPAQNERRSHDYFRHGSLDLFAALDVSTGKVITRTHARHRSVEFVRFLDAIDEEVSPDLDVHVVLDNLSTHKTPRVHRWLIRHPRFQLHFTPTHASWLNQVERWFAGLTERQLRRGSHRSKHELRGAIEAYIAAANEAASPFVWVKSADQILQSIARFARRTLEAHAQMKLTSDSGH